MQPNSIKFESGFGHYANPGVGGAYASSGAFLVSEQGVRFANEQGNAYDLREAMKANEHTYLILDQTSFDAFNQGMIGSAIYTQEQVDQWVANNGASDPVMVKQDSLEELAAVLSIPEGALSETFQKYNTGLEADEFGRQAAKPMSEEGPYYAIEMWIRYYATLGGLHINDQMQVLNTALEPVEGLYAAGETVGGLEGDIYYPGSLFGWAMASGYNAGMAAAEAVK